jgi:hypothetical protein
MNKKIIQKSTKFFTTDERHKIIQEYLASDLTKVEIWNKYTGMPEENGRLLAWMRKLGYDTNVKGKYSNIGTNSSLMAKKKSSPNKLNSSDDESFEHLQLKKRIAELEKQLKDAELKAIAFSTMVDIAEKEFNIPIRKKFNTKP